MLRAFFALGLLALLPWVAGVAEPKPSTWCPEPCTCSEERATPRKVIPPYWTAGKIEWKNIRVDASSSSAAVQLHLYRIDCNNRDIEHVDTVLDVALLARHHHAHNDTISSSIHPSSPYITTLSLSGNRIKYLDRRQFGTHRLWQRHLRRLHLDQNQLRRLENGTFSLLPALEHLNLARNEIHTLESHCFQGLHRLVSLDLSSNRLSVFPSDAIQPAILRLLAELNLHHNQIEWLPSEAFNREGSASGSSNSSLTKFDLSANPLKQLHVDAFVNLSKLRKIQLSEVRNQEMFPSLRNSNSIEHIRIDRSRIKAIDEKLCHFVGDTLKSLVLKSNQIDHLPPLELCTELRVLDLSYNELKTVGVRLFATQQKLIDLALSNNQIGDLKAEAFVGLSQLKVLNAQYNRIGHIDPRAFAPLASLRDLNLGHNHFSRLPTEGLANIVELKVHGNRNLREFPPMESFPYVHTLAMSYAYHCCPYLGRLQMAVPSTSLPEDDSSNSSPHLHDSILWLEDIDDHNVNLTINELAQQFWKIYSQPSLDYSDYEQEQMASQFGHFSNDLYAAIESPSSYSWDTNLETEQPRVPNIYLQAGQPGGTGHPIRCLPTPGPFMPCRDLFDWWTLRTGVWIVFPLALIGNGMVLVVLVFGRRKRRRNKLDVPRFLVCNLAAADFFMGIYLGMLALVDASTLGHFRAYAIKWQNSWGCQLTGFMGVFSAELSVYTLAVITLERNYAITHAMHLNKRLSLRAATTVMSVGWCLALTMALLPLFGISDYRKFAVCLPFETDDSPWSLLYVLTLILFNGFAFLLLMGCYLRMYCAIRGSQAWNSNDTRIAMRMGLLVFTDFLCWAPIAFFTLTALAGWHLISLEEAKIFTVFVLPLNACANPFLYAFFTKQFKKECANLSKRIDAVTSFRHRFLGHTIPEVVNEAEIAEAVAAAVVDSDCKICGHRDSVRSQPEADIRQIACRVASVAVPSSKTKDEIRVIGYTRHSLDHQLATVQLNYDKNDPIVNRGRSVEVIERVEQSRDSGDSAERTRVEDCSCQCHGSEMSHKNSPRKAKLRISKSDATSQCNHKSWNAGLFVRQLFLFADKNPKRSNVRRVPVSKKHKSNSIIYQSNYRKNHVHMALENEVRACKSGRHQKLTRYSSDNIETRKTTKRGQMDSGPNLSTSSPVKLHDGDRSVSVANSVGGSKSGTSSSSVNKSRSNKLSDLGRYSEVDKSMTMLDPIELQGNQHFDKSDRSPNRSQEMTNDEVSYVKHTTQSAMSSGIMMLKNKFIRKSFPRKLSSDSQYEFSYYSNRKDSTSTGRLSFSSENATKSTSSSFVSSGIWNSTRQQSNESKHIKRDCVVTSNKYNALMHLSRPITPHFEKFWREYTNVERVGKVDGSTRYLVLTLGKRELHSVVLEKHSTHRMHPSYEQCLREEVDESLEMSSISNNASKLPKVTFDDQTLYVVYLLQRGPGCVIPVVEDDEAHFCFDKIEAYLVAPKLDLCDEESSVQNELDLIEIDLTLCSDCIQHYLLNKLFKHIATEELAELDHFDHLSVYLLFFHTSMRLVSDLTEEDMAEEMPPKIEDRLDDPNKKVQANSKKLSNSHERILNFLQILLPKSARSSKSTENSLYEKSENIKRPAVVGVQRRSSSAFVLGEAEMERGCRLEQQELCIKSCSQLQVMSPATGSGESSPQDARCRSVISDVVITIVHDNQDHEPEVPLESKSIAQYNSLPKYSRISHRHNPLEEKYHSYEFIA